MLASRPPANRPRIPVHIGDSEGFQRVHRTDEGLMFVVALAKGSRVPSARICEDECIVHY